MFELKKSFVMNTQGGNGLKVFVDRYGSLYFTAKDGRQLCIYTRLDSEGKPELAVGLRTGDREDGIKAGANVLEDEKVIAVALGMGLSIRSLNGEVPQLEGQIYNYSQQVVPGTKADGEITREVWKGEDWEIAVHNYSRDQGAYAYSFDRANEYTAEGGSSWLKARRRLPNGKWQQQMLRLPPGRYHIDGVAGQIWFLDIEGAVRSVFDVAQWRVSGRVGRATIFEGDPKDWGILAKRQSLAQTRIYQPGQSFMQNMLNRGSLQMQLQAMLPPTFNPNHVLRELKALGIDATSVDWQELGAAEKIRSIEDRVHEFMHGAKDGERLQAWRQLKESLTGAYRVDLAYERLGIDRHSPAWKKLSIEERQVLLDIHLRHKLGDLADKELPTPEELRNGDWGSDNFDLINSAREVQELHRFVRNPRNNEDLR